MSKLEMNLMSYLTEMKNELKENHNELKRDVIKMRDDFANKTETIIENKVKLAIYTAGGGVFGGGFMVVMVEMAKKIMEK